MNCPRKTEVGNETGKRETRPSKWRAVAYQRMEPSCTVLQEAGSASDMYQRWTGVLFTNRA